MPDNGDIESALNNEKRPGLEKSISRRKWHLQLDLAPFYSSRQKVKILKKKTKLRCWPGNSPDANPVEHLWFRIKSRLLKKEADTVRKFV
ncbi:unnamed protein product [Clavelina lepadiformis]|uniref:Tc1-like transposase DDE domain-containing protein n=1 Tax=Clavelina lepadiformis TaxID=159417 RepID=A0ABP0GM18_CLALP